MKSKNMKELKNKIKELLRESVEVKNLVLKENVEISQELKYHIENNLTLTENIFMLYSEKYFDLINEVRGLWEKGLISLNEEDTDLVESDLGKTVIVEGQTIYLDAPYELYEEEAINEAKHRGKNVKLNKPFRTPGGPKKFAVYVKTPKGTIKKVTFGDPNMKTRAGNKKAAKSFSARHKCAQKKDRTTAGYWACRVPRFSGKNKGSSKFW